MKTYSRKSWVTDGNQCLIWQLARQRSTIGLDARVIIWPDEDFKSQVDTQLTQPEMELDTCTTVPEIGSLGTQDSKINCPTVCVDEEEHLDLCSVGTDLSEDSHFTKSQDGQEEVSEEEEDSEEEEEDSVYEACEADRFS